MLSDPASRRRYDATGSAVPRPARPSAAHAAASQTPSPQPQARPRLTRRGAGWMVVGGIGCLAFGVIASVLVLALQRHDAAVRADGVAATATVVLVGDERRLEFFTTEGERVVADEPLKSGTGRPAVGSQVEIIYDPDDPTSVVRDESELARDITLWVVAIKLLVGGVVFVAFGTHRLRRG